MVYLASQGHFVVGVELSSIACGDFFKENRIPFSIKTVNDFTVYESKNISIWCGDFFKLPNSVWEKCCGSYDRAAYIALPSEARMKYAEEFRKKGKHNFEIFLVTVEYPKGTLQGPPFSIQEEEITKNFKDFCIEKLSTAPWKVGENTFEEAVYWLKR
jgi:thiopurine S-methyltransferase